MKSIFVMLVVGALSLAAVAKLPAPSEEAKAKAAEAAAKTAHTGKTDNYLLCKYQDKTAASYYKTAKSNSKETKPAATLPPCVDPGPFVYAPVAPMAAASEPATSVGASATPSPVAGKDAKKP